MTESHSSTGWLTTYTTVLDVSRNILFIKVNAVMVLSSSISSPSRMFPVFTCREEGQTLVLIVCDTRWMR